MNSTFPVAGLWLHGGDRWSLNRGGGMGFVKQMEGAEEPLLYPLAPRW